MLDEDQHGSDAHAILFGDPEDRHPDDFAGIADDQARITRADRHHRAHRTRRHHGPVFAIVAVLVVAVVGLSGWFVGRPFLDDHLQTKDFSSAGTGQVLVRVHQGDAAGDIATTLLHSQVVASTRAFTNAAADDSRSRLIQPGTYQLHRHMSAKSALALLLDPASRVSKRVTIPEGATSLDVTAKLAAALGVPVAQITAALAKPAALGLPASYARVGGGAPTSAEGFLYPDTYDFDPGTSPSDALQQMTADFTNTDHDLGFASAAAPLKLTPYQALIIASIAESEAKFDADRAKVARVILNRLAANRPLQIDATSAYGAKLLGLDPTAVNYATIDSPYNSYTHPGLPPTPIANPGEASLKAAISPPAGDWLFYVNGDAEGHLSFFDNDTDFAAAVAVCQANNWGCG